MGQEERISLSGLQIPSMVDAIDPQVHPVGAMSRELRNLEWYRGIPHRRRGWSRLFDTRLPFETCINAKDGAWRDTGGRLHRVWFGDDSRIYHALGEAPTAWTEVTQHFDVAFTWDATYRAVFAPHGDELYVALWQPPEAAVVPADGVQNIRIDGLSDATDPAGLFHAYGVSLPAPGNAPTLAAAAGGNMPFGVYSYFTTHYDVATGQESDASAIATITLAQAAAPTQAPTAADGGAGLMPAGTFQWAYCFLNTATGVRSPLSPPAQLTLAAGRQLAFTNIRVCAEAGAWNRELYVSEGGAVYTLAVLIADNVTETAAYNLAAPPGPDYDEGLQGVNLTNIALYAGGGTPANGRTVYNRIYRSDNGQTSFKPLTAGVAELLDNATQVYADTLAEAAGDLWSRSVRVPASGIVCAGPDDTVIWANNRADMLPAQIYQSKNDEAIESIAVDADNVPIESLKAGTHDDPITAAEDARDGWIIGKRRAIHYMGRECANCERLLKDRGNVAPGTMQTIGTRIAILTPEGPGYVDHTRPDDFVFCGPIAERFCLEATWQNVVKSRLPYATSFHWRDAALIGWVVQTCDTWPVGPHNDTCIVWDYSVTNGGRIWIIDLPGCDSCMKVPIAGSDSYYMEACFAYGVAARLFTTGNTNDGTVGKLTGTVIAASGTLVDVDVTALQGQDVVGSILWINGGTGSRICRPVSACENARSLIVSTCGGKLTTAGVLTIAEGSAFEIGGYQDVIDSNINAGNPQAIKQWLTAHMRID